LPLFFTALSEGHVNSNEVRFSVTAHAEWFPERDAESPLSEMPALLRRRASIPGKMALIAAYRCINENSGNTQPIPTLFCSRHGECDRSVNLLNDLANNIPLSPMSFSLATHNATSGLLSIARNDKTNSISIASGKSTIEHAVIEACGLLADGEPAVLLIAYDNQLPEIFKDYQDCLEQSYAWAWIIQPANENCISLSWSLMHTKEKSTENTAGIEIFDFFIHKKLSLERICDGQHWQWQHHS
jgi:hypothetical protein